MTPRLATTTVIALALGVIIGGTSAGVVFTITLLLLVLWLLIVDRKGALDRIEEVAAERDAWVRQALAAERQWAADLHATPHDTTVAEVLGSVTPLFQSVVSESNPPAQPPRCGECRMGLGVHNHADLLCEARPTTPPTPTNAGGRDD